MYAAGNGGLSRRPSRAIRLGLLSALAVLASLGGPGCKDSSSRRKAGVAPGILFVNEMVPNADASDPDSPAILRDETGAPILDASGDPVDWIEVYNASSKSIKLGKVFLSDDPANPRLFRFPKKMKIGPGGFLIVICDGRPELGPLHAPFTLDAAGETVRMYSTSKKGKNVTLDEARYVNLPANVSVGHYPDGEFEYGIIYVATPGEPNKPVGVKPPRVDGDAGLGPVTAPDDLTPLTIRVLEDRELLAASVEVLEVEDCAALPGGGPMGPFAGPFDLDVVEDQTEEVIEQRTNHLDEPIDVPFQRLLLAGLLPHFEAGASLFLRFRLENVMGVVMEEQCQVVVGGGEPLLAFHDSAWVDPRCPAPTEPTSVFTFLHVAESTAARGDLAADLEVTLAWQTDGSPGGSIDLGSGLEIAEIDACEKECFELTDVESTRLFRVRGEIPAQAAGRLVTFSFSARDLVRDEAAVLDGSTASNETSLRYRSGFQPPSVTFNEVLPLDESTLADLYPQSVRNDPAFRPPDYAELYNDGDAAVNVAGMFLTATRERTCPSDGAACADLIDRPREFSIPAPASIPAKEFFVFLFVSDDARNTAPDLAGAGLAGKTVLVGNSIQLDDCRGTLVLLSGDAGGNCPVATVGWDFRADPGAPECAPGDLVPDTPLGLLPDGLGDPLVLGTPTPGESNCLGAAPEIEGDVAASIDGPPDDCLDADQNAAAFSFRVLLDWRQTVLDPAGLGVQAVEFFATGAGGEEQVDATVTVATAEPDPRVDVDAQTCRVLLEVTASDVGLPADPGTEVSYRLRLTDTNGGEVEAGPFTFDVCAKGGLFIRGDANLDLSINVTDLVWINFVIFGIFPPTSCMDALDSNDDGLVDPQDFLYLANFIFRRGPRVPDPFPDPGTDPTPDDLTCEQGVNGMSGL